MIDIQQLRYEKLDRPEIGSVLFHPRSDQAPPPEQVELLSVPVAPAVDLEVRCHWAEDPQAAQILFFHGARDLAADYDQSGGRFTDQGLSFLVVGYRGYGRSGGEPGVTAMLQDAHAVLAAVGEELARRGRKGKLAVMGRSLGSVAAIELAASEAMVDGLIIESGIAQTIPFLQALGVDVRARGIDSEADGFKNVQKMALVTKPVYILHGQHDQLVPLANAESLQAHCAARNKEFQMVPGADHRTVMERAGRLYYQAIHQFTRKLSLPQRPPRAGVRS